MRPLEAIIIAASKKTGLKIRTESGLIETLSYNKKYHVGQKVAVAYDFTRNRITQILNQDHYEKGVSETAPIEGGEQEDEDLGLLVS